MTLSKTFFWSVGFALATTVLAAQGAGPGMGGRCQGQEAPFLGGRMASLLNLTAAQQAGVKAVAEKHRAALEARQKAAFEAHDALRTALRDPAAGDDQLKTLQARAGDAQLAVMLERRAMMRECEALLTADQLKVLKEHQPKDGMGHGMGHHGHGMEGF